MRAINDVVARGLGIPVPEHPVIDGKPHEPADYSVTVDMPKELGGLRRRIPVKGAFELHLRDQITESAMPNSDPADPRQGAFKAWIVARARQERLRLKAEAAKEAVEYQRRQAPRPVA